MKKNKTPKRSNFKNYALNTAAAATIAAGIAAPNVQTQAQTQPNTQQQTQMPTNTRIPLEQTMKVAKFFQEGQTDSLLNIIEKNLYAQSGNLYKLSQNPNLRSVNGVDFIDLMQVGVNYWGDGKIEGRFKDEHERSQSTTWATYANIAGLTEQELKKSINLTNGIPVRDLRVLYGRDGKYSTVIYTGREDLGKLLRDREGINGQATIRNHVNKNRGISFSVPKYSVFNAMGYDFTVPELVQKVDIIKEQKRLLEERVEELEEKKDELKQERDSIQKEQTRTIQERDSIQEEVRKWNVSLLGGINAYADEKRNRPILTPEAGMYATINNIGLGVKYSFPVSKELRVDFEELRPQPPTDPDRPNHDQLVRETTTKYSLDNHAIQGMVGYKINEVFTPFITAGIDRGKDITKTQNYFYKERPGPNNTVHITDEHMDGVHTDIQKYTAPRVGIGTFINIPNSRLGVTLDAAYSKRFGITGSASLKYDLRSTNARRNQNNNNNNNGRGR